MSTPDSVRPGGQWYPEMVPGASDFQRFDDAQFPERETALPAAPGPRRKPIWIGGAGLVSSVDDDGSGKGTRMVGGAHTRTGGGIVIAASANDFPQLAPARTRTIRVPIISMVQDPIATPAGPQLVFDDANGWGLVGTGAGAGEAFIEIPGRFLHIGARLASVGVEFKITKKPTSVPTDAPFLEGPGDG